MLVETNRTAARLFLLMVATVYVLAYVFRWIYLSYYLHSGIVLTDVRPDWNVITVTAFNEAFVISSIIFGVFFLTTKKMNSRAKNFTRVGYNIPGFWVTIIFVVIVVISLIVRKAYGTVLGEAPAEIPYGLGTPIYRAQADLFPGMLLLFAEAAWFAGARRTYLVWVLGLAFFNLAMAVLTTSKAGLIYFAVQFIMLMYLTGQNIFARPLRLALLAIAGIAVFIISAQLRSQALLGTDALILHSLKEGRVVETLLEVVGMIVNRLPGTEGLALYCGYNCSGIPTLTIPNLNGEAGRFFTQDVINVRNEFDFRSPGFIGGAVIIAGLWGGALLAIGFLRSLLMGFRLADQRGLSAAAKITLCFAAFRFILEGIWAWQDVASALIAAALVEMASRAILRTRTRDPMETHTVQYI